MKYPKRFTKYDEHHRPRCKDCGGVVPWNGLGRPKARCPKCTEQAEGRTK